MPFFRHSYKVVRLQPVFYKRVPYLLPVSLCRYEIRKVGYRGLWRSVGKKTSANIFGLTYFNLVAAPGTYFNSIIVSLFNTIRRVDEMAVLSTTLR